MKRSLIAAVIALCLAVPLGREKAIAAATLLPNGSQCFSANTGTTGMVGTLGTITGGSGGTAGTYGGVALTGGTGSGATANITVAAGAVTAVTILNPGSAYTVGDTLSAASGNIGSTTGFSVPVASIAINSALAGGSVYFYFPNTSSLKQTWQDSAQVTLNTNPVVLDSNGCATIYGTGIYRQVVQDSLGNTVWDKTTADTSSNNSTFWAGTATGTANVIAIVDTGFNATDGSIINFVPIATNTTATTLNPSSFGAIPIVKDTTAGPVALTGGEIVAASAGSPNVVSVIYSASQNNFHLLNTVIASASGASAPLCGATGLNITVATNSTVTITAGQVVMQTAAGLVINRSNVSVTLNVTTGTATSAANGMDGETIGTSDWLYVWLIDNGAAAASVGSKASGNGLTPNMPSGYTYKCRMGAVSVDSGGLLLRTIQKGSTAQYVISSTGNTTALPIIGNGAVGTFSSTNPVLASATVTGDGFCAPSTATGIYINAYTSWKGGTVSSMLVAPSTGWGFTNSGPQGSIGLVWPIALLFSGAGATTGTQAFFKLESSAIGWASGAAGAVIACHSWTDNVNAT